MKEKLEIRRELKMKLERVLGLAYTAVYGHVTGLRDGSCYTMERCRDLGQVLNSANYHVTGSTETKLQLALRDVADEEQKWINEGNNLPY